MPKAIPLTAIKADSRNTSSVVCYKGAWGCGQYYTWGEFIKGTASLRRHIQTVDAERWILYCEDYWLFLLAFTALLQCKKQVLLSANTGCAYIAEIQNFGNTGKSNKSDSIPFLSDQTFTAQDEPDSFFNIQSLLKQSEASCLSDAEFEMPPINGDETSIIMFTSGSTGKPKAVEQRLTEFENDNKFILSMWGDEFLSRKLCSTVSQHHIYGLLFSILLPFTAGVPFKKERIQVSEEFEKLDDTEYMIITVPAFLKRAVELYDKSVLSLKSPWIFTSGGLLTKDIAEKTSGVFGFWPIEVYGSTETSGIAWRQSCNGPEWTAFDNARLSVNNHGCLVVRSPYIKDSAGFETADMVELLDDKRFVLKGRVDSVVKIEEKRVSLAEIEERIMQSGLAQRAYVIAMEDRRQYLAAAIVFNDKAKQMFAGKEKLAINKYWREYLLKYFENTVLPKKWRYPESLPIDAQGKIQKEDIIALFNANETISDTAIGKIPYCDKVTVIEKTDNTLTLQFTVSASSPYFDGHFPQVSILPAVAQTEIVVRFASLYLGTDIALKEIKRAKFTSFIKPDNPVCLKIERKDASLCFKMNSPDGQKVYSAGTLSL